MRVPHLLIGVGAFITLSTGCGTVFNGARQNISVVSSPEGAKIATNPAAGDYSTPTTLRLQRKNDYTLTFTKDGYSSATAQIDHHVRAGIVVLDVLLAGLIGVIIDASTGAWSKLSPETVNVSLQKVAAIEGPDRIYVSLSVEANGTDGVVNVHSSDPGVRVLVEKR